MWLLLAFLSAALLGFYDVFKKQSLKDNAVLPVLFLNTVFSSLVFLPFIGVSYWAPQMLQDTIFFVPEAGWEAHRLILIKSFIVLSSWMLGYFGMKHLPITIFGSHQCHTPCYGTDWCHAILWRALEPLSMDWCLVGYSLVLLTESFRTERRHWFQTRPLDLLCGAGGYHGGC